MAYVEVNAFPSASSAFNSNNCHYFYFNKKSMQMSHINKMTVYMFHDILPIFIPNYFDFI